MPLTNLSLGSNEQVADGCYIRDVVEDLGSGLRQLGG